ncbi:MAG: hypothetical protein ICV62_19020 [Cyanobacteria bacterium Co-bin13]|nr:hypothetical protein [Cyanobacteria bacterium Co-bin13]
MMTNFVSTPLQKQSSRPLTHADSTQEPRRETAKIAVTGSPNAVDAIIRDLHSRRFAEVNDWCPPMPTGRPGEIIRVLLKRLWL